SSAIKQYVSFGASEAVNVAGWIAMSAGIYIILLLVFRLIKKDELRRIPIIGRLIVR
ncbi:stage V sporulation protein B, partial [Bacillus inaquosorum]|nr:stage V sporulation protein B [Bacillus inaquosorum]